MEKVISVEALENYRLHVKFDDGIEGIVDCVNSLYGTVFEPLKDPAFFAQVSIDDFGAVCWPNGADLAPDAMHENLRSQQAKVAEDTPDYEA